MMTPQEVASRAFPRAKLGGYNMSQVDDFLDLLTEDYTTLYNDNAILKNKLKVLSDTIEEYRAVSDLFDEDLYEEISLETCVGKRISAGSTGPESVAEQIRSTEAFLEN